ncbi:MAG TPA: riboflavin synthase [Ignavibacteria bacterium]|nr:riboflavin synthase [Ignavibacteria bacterium]HMR39045.1 riboflavin synthase [Ignavibacteria bacterium]
MFTGIIQDKGKIVKRTVNKDSIRFTVKPESKIFTKNLKIGDSISINGACMTVENIISGEFSFTTIKESLSKTNLSALKSDDLVNLEEAMTLRSKLDGHIVQGHVDCTGTVKKITKLKDSWEYFIEFSSEFSQNIIPIGSIAINGVSLTIAAIPKENAKNVLIKVAIIPHTFKHTNFSKLKAGDTVNIEFDILGKYVNRIFKNHI